MFKRNGSTTRIGLTTCLALILGLASASTAFAATTIGQVPAAAPGGTGGCAGASSDFVQPTVTGGAPYVVPSGGEAITSWSTFAASNANQVITMKVLRQVSGLTYQVVGHDGPRNLTPNVLQGFKTNIAVKPGDVLGLSHGSGSSIACSFPVPGENGELWSTFTDLQDGQSATFAPTGGNARLNLSAEVASKPSNDFSFGKVKKKKRKGIAILTVVVPGPGSLKLAGAGIKPQRSAGASISKAVSAAGPVKLKVKAKGRKKRKLLHRGRVKVKAKVTYTPSGDLPGIPNTERKKIKLVDKG